MKNSNKKDESKLSGRLSAFSAENGTLRELKESTAKLKSEVQKERSIFSNYSLIDGGKKITRI